MEVSAELVSRVTDAVHGEIREWQSRPLEEVYAIVYMDGVNAEVKFPSFGAEGGLEH